MAVGVGWGLVSILLDLAVLRKPSIRRGLPPRDARPADGEVGHADLAGARGEPNRKDRDFQRFVAFDPIPGEPGRLPRPPVRADFPALLGRVVVLSVFIGRDGKEWSDEEIAMAHRALRRAGEWIEREAIRWGATVNIDLASTYFAARDDRPADATPVPLSQAASALPHFDETEQDRFVVRERVDAIARFSGVARRLGLADAADLTARVAGRVEADHHVWLLHHRCAGQSIAVPCDLSDLPGVTLAVCYAREDDVVGPLAGPPFPDPVTFVHELMHLFGAMDRYDQSFDAFPAGSVTDRDVMLLEYESLPRLRIDPLTSVEIGWAKPGAEAPAEPRKGNRRAPGNPRRGG
jgi:hypothetical protein